MNEINRKNREERKDISYLKSMKIETNRLILRHFTATDLDALYQLLSDREVNTFLPWFPVKDLAETQEFFTQHLAEQKYCFALCRQGTDYPIGYVNIATDDSHDLGYALSKAYWHQGFITEACNAVIPILKAQALPYITATHDRNNPKSGAVMQRIGMKYCYSYQEQWQPKNFPVVFRLYQLNLDGQNDRIYRQYWHQYAEHFIETGL